MIVLMTTAHSTNSTVLGNALRARDNIPDRNGDFQELALMLN
jgi:hypothetical protein